MDFTPVPSHRLIVNEYVQIIEGEHDGRVGQIIEKYETSFGRVHFDVWLNSGYLNKRGEVLMDPVRVRSTDVVHVYMGL